MELYRTKDANMRMKLTARTFIISMALAYICDDVTAATIQPIKPPAPAPTYEVDGKLLSATDAILAYLQGHKVYQHKTTKTAFKSSETITEMEVQDGKTGPKLVARKGN